MILERLRSVFRFGLAVMATPLVGQVAESRLTKPPAPENITFELLAPAAESRPTESRGPHAVAVLRITNKNAEAVTLWPFVALEIRDAAGSGQKPSSNRGRWGRREANCFLEAVNFATVQPGKSIDWPVRLDLYTHDANSILGWKLKPGAYTLIARYAFSRSAFIARCKSGCESHADVLRPWNAALELTRDASLKITVK